MKTENKVNIEGNNNTVNQIDKMFVLPQTSSDYEPDEYAAKLLQSAASDEDDPTIVFIKTNCGHSIKCGRKFSVGESSVSKREMSYWEDALRNLAKHEYIVPTSYKNEVFNITKKGYDFCDKLDQEK